MKPGIEREEILGVLTEMACCLEETDMNLQESLLEIRETMYNVHASHIEETNMLLDKMEGELPKSMKPKNETASLKLEMSF
ncbi:hypothetical protein [Mesobacillus jeotgali]|uniref:hypothetical protein n=1 Tax=Mesobacillus jeotgali TaxID=129985 RepID=UPI0009A6B676|nr:hypothetical protein [Mesobacillus jeotgali]